MGNAYQTAKAIQTAQEIVKHHNIDFITAFKITTRIWDEARSAILRHCPAETWQKLTRQERAEVAGKVVKALIDKKKLIGFLADGKRLC